MAGKVALKCRQCDSSYLVFSYRRLTSKFCSYRCAARSRVPWNKGLKNAQTHSDETRKKMSRLHKGKWPWWAQKYGSEHVLWKGNRVSYSALHHWVRRKLGSANHCVECGLDEIPIGKKKYFDWANISGNYQRDLKDWKQLCKKCHVAFDSVTNRKVNKN